MKKILAILLFVSLFSCSVNDEDTPRSQTEFLPIESVSMPDVFRRNYTYTIDLVYYKPSSCHVFNGIYSTTNTNESTIAVVSQVYTNISDCQEVMTEAEASFNFRPTVLGTHVFKFWHSESDVNNTNQDNYLIYEIEVVE
ncbi:hypothetical protein [Lacinutrix sp. MEBiC02595]